MMFPRTLLFMLFCAGLGYFLGRSRGMGIQGFFFGLAFGPLGWALILLWPRSWIQGPIPRQGYGPAGTEAYAGSAADSGAGFASEAGNAREFRGGAPGQASGHGCPRCGCPAERDAGSCLHCGNVLVPIRYAVEDRKPPAS